MALIPSLGFFGDVVAQHAFLDGEPLPQRRAWNFDGSKFQIVDNPSSEALEITTIGSGGTGGASFEPAVPIADANVVIDVSQGKARSIATLTANRTIDVDPDGATDGDIIRIQRKTLAAYNATVRAIPIGGGDPTTIEVLQANYVGVIWVQFIEGTGWVLYQLSKHGPASASAAGLLSSTHYDLLAGATQNATADTLAKRGPAGEIEFGQVNCSAINYDGTLPITATDEVSLTSNVLTLISSAGDLDVQANGGSVNINGSGTTRVNSETLVWIGGGDIQTLQLDNSGWAFGGVTPTVGTYPLTGNRWAQDFVATRIAADVAHGFCTDGTTATATAWSFTTVTCTGVVCAGTIAGTAGGAGTGLTVNCATATIGTSNETTANITTANITTSNETTANVTTLNVNDIVFPTGELTPTITQVVKASGNGVDMKIQPQAGSGTNKSGDLYLGKDNGSSAPNHNVVCVLGAKTTGTADGKLSLRSDDTTEKFYIQPMYSGGFQFIHGTGSLYVESASGVTVRSNDGSVSTSWQQSDGGIVHVSNYVEFGGQRTCLPNDVATTSGSITINAYLGDVATVGVAAGLTGTVTIGFSNASRKGLKLTVLIKDNGQTINWTGVTNSAAVTAASIQALFDANQLVIVEIWNIDGTLRFWKAEGYAS